MEREDLGKHTCVCGKLQLLYICLKWMHQREKKILVRKGASSQFPATEGFNLKPIIVRKANRDFPWSKDNFQKIRKNKTDSKL